MEVGASKRYLKERCAWNVFKCPNSDKTYEVHEDFTCSPSYDIPCPDDPMFYQACGHYDESRCGSDIARVSLMFCGTLVCETQKAQETISDTISGTKATYITCNNIASACKNTDVNEKLCGTTHVFDRCYYFILDQEPSEPEIICNGVCDCWEDCQDEVVCNNHIYGTVCSGGNRFSAQKSCQGSMITEYATWITEYATECIDEDSIKCTDIVRQCKTGNNTRDIFPNQICAVPQLLANKDGLVDYNIHRVCDDGLDQINCSDSTRVALICEMHGYKTTLSVYAICMGYDLCDNGYHNVCTEPENGCFIHKSQLCDEKLDCPLGSDENDIHCAHLTVTKCVRKVNKNQPADAKRFPHSWIIDGQEDCVDGSDEVKSKWFQCGSDSLSRFSEEYFTCIDVFLCPRGDGFVEFPFLCDKIESCGKENLVCQQSKALVSNLEHVLFSKDNTMKILSPCLHGLVSLSILLGECKAKPFNSPDGEIFGVTQFGIQCLTKKQDCNNFFGEFYVYLSCSDSCEDSKCPLHSVDDSSCINIPKEKQIHSLTSHYAISLVRRVRNLYFADYFPCKNRRCVPYSKVCNLVDDCGDKSDEEGCTNSFYCTSSSEFVPLTAVCDGKVDCRDFTDECGSQCSVSSNQLLKYPGMSGIAWTFGILATILNLVCVARVPKSFMTSKVFHHRMDKLLIMLVSLGDLSMGLYLLGIALANRLYSTRYCKEKFMWLTSEYCNFFGILNTIASQLSLFSMTALSLSRVYNLKIMIPSSGTSKFAWFKFIAVAVLIILASSIIALVPLMPAKEDYFVSALYYDGVTLFTGLVNKETHQRVLQSYNNRYRRQDLSWETIRDMTRMMFSEGYGGVRGKTVGFYGNDGVCIFKYLVTSSDPQYLFSLSILLFNLICFIVITTCYVILNVTVSKVSKVVTGGPSSQRRNQNKLNAKVSIIIVTDFLCWIPFIVITLVHFTEIIDASHFYPIFSIVILPINSVINPLLYEKAFEDAITELISRFRQMRLRQKINNRNIVVPERTIATDITADDLVTSVASTEL